MQITIGYKLKSLSLSRSISSRKMFHYWQKYLTLQHCEWTCFVKFLFRIYFCSTFFLLSVMHFYVVIMRMINWLRCYLCTLCLLMKREEIKINFRTAIHLTPKREKEKQAAELCTNRTFSWSFKLIISKRAQRTLALTLTFKCILKALLGQTGLVGNFGFDKKNSQFEKKFEQWFFKWRSCKSPSDKPWNFVVVTRVLQFNWS